MVVKIEKNNINSTDLNIEELTIKYPLFASTYTYLLKKHNKHELSVVETLKEIEMSNSDFYTKKKKGKDIPCYRQKNEKSKISFPLVCVALFLSQDFVKVD